MLMYNLRGIVLFLISSPLVIFSRNIGTADRKLQLTFKKLLIKFFGQDTTFNITRV